MRPLRTPLALLAALAVTAAGCGSDDGDGAAATPPPEPMPTAAPADFPPAGEQTLAELSEGLPEGPIFAPSVSLMRVGENRVGFALFDRSRKLVDAQEVAVYTARPDGSDVTGPFPARKESIAVKPQFQSATTAADLKGGDTIYVAEVPFEQEGDRVLTALARLDGRLVAATDFPLPLPVGAENGPPDVGEPAIEVDTLTAADVGGDLEQITTRVPPSEAMLDTNFADVLGEKPVVLQFATPQLCATQVCGPVVDIAEEVRSSPVGEGVTFIQQEIFVDNEVDKGFREQVGTWRLPTEPWTFVIDREGNVAERFEGAFSVGELARAVEAVK